MQNCFFVGSLGLSIGNSSKNTINESFYNKNSPQKCRNFELFSWILSFSLSWDIFPWVFFIDGQNSSMDSDDDSELLGSRSKRSSWRRHHPSTEWSAQLASRRGWVHAGREFFMVYLCKIFPYKWSNCLEVSIIRRVSRLVPEWKWAYVCLKRKRCC